MLKDAALVTLEMMELCLAKNLILKDASAYNVRLLQWTHGVSLIRFRSRGIEKASHGRVFTSLLRSFYYL